MKKMKTNMHTNFDEEIDAYEEEKLLDQMYFLGIVLIGTLSAIGLHKIIF